MFLNTCLSPFASVIREGILQCLTLKTKMNFQDCQECHLLLFISTRNQSQVLSSEKKGHSYSHKTKNTP